MTRAAANLTYPHVTTPTQFVEANDMRALAGGRKTRSKFSGDAAHNPKRRLHTAKRFG
jgi:hypothetical protein